MAMMRPKPPVIKRDRKPGEPPLHRIGVFDHEGRMVGHVGHRATEVTASRFLGRQLGAELKKKDGRPAWIGDKPPPPPPPPPILVQRGAFDGGGAPGMPKPDPKSLAADKGSVTSKPGPPAPRTRPRG
jgi:hypothetical protein